MNKIQKVANRGTFQNRANRKEADKNLSEDVRNTNTKTRQLQ